MAGGGVVRVRRGRSWGMRWPRRRHRGRFASVHLCACATARPGHSPGARHGRGRLVLGPGEDRLVVDVDSFVGELYGYDRQRAGYGYTGQAWVSRDRRDRAETGGALHNSTRKGSSNTARGALRFRRGAHSQLAVSRPDHRPARTVTLRVPARWRWRPRRRPRPKHKHSRHAPPGHSLTAPSPSSRPTQRPRPSQTPPISPEDRFSRQLPQHQARTVIKAKRLTKLPRGAWARNRFL